MGEVVEEGFEMTTTSRNTWNKYHSRRSWGVLHWESGRHLLALGKELGMFLSDARGTIGD